MGTGGGLPAIRAGVLYLPRTADQRGPHPRDLAGQRLSSDNYNCLWKDKPPWTGRRELIVKPKTAPTTGPPQLQIADCRPP